MTFNNVDSTREVAEFCAHSNSIRWDMLHKNVLLKVYGLLSGLTALSYFPGNGLPNPLTPENIFQGTIHTRFMNYEIIPRGRMLSKILLVVRHTFVYHSL